MGEVEELEARIMKLSSQDRAKLRDWFLQLDDQLWDQQIAADSKAGKFKGLIDKARAEFAQGKAREL
jgi:hypothetical protein